MGEIQEHGTQTSIPAATLGNGTTTDDRVHVPESGTKNIATAAQIAGSRVAYPTPWKDNGLSSEEKKEKIAYYFSKILDTIGMDLTDDSIKETPSRVAKMYVDEIFCGLKPENFPKIMQVDNKFKYEGMVTEINITMNSVCEHHFVPIVGHVHVSYVPGEKVIGLSKLNRIVDYFSRRPQVQERLTNQIADCLSKTLNTDDIAVVIDGLHSCVKIRGVKDSSSVTRTAFLGGVYKESAPARTEFFSSIPRIKQY